MKHSQSADTKQHLYCKLLLVISFICAFFVFTNRANALETKIAVSPAIIEAPLNIGSSVTRSVEVRNGSDFAVPISIEIQSAQPNADYIDSVDISRFNVANWVDMDQDIYVFGPGEIKRIPFTVTAPFTAVAGGHYAQMSIRTLSLEKNVSDQSGALVFPEVAVPILITVPGEIKEQIRVSKDFSLPLLVQPNTSVKTTIPIENVGTIHNRVKAKFVVIKDDIEVKSINMDPLVLYPYTKKDLSIEWLVDSFGVYEVFVELQYGSRNEIFSTIPKTVRSTPPVFTLLQLAVAVWIFTYTIHHRNNLRRSFAVLKKGY